jgi:glycine dehydrogenase subunit 2
MTDFNPRKDVGARLSFDRGQRGRRGVEVSRWQGARAEDLPANLTRDRVRLPEMSQGEVVRYYTELSTRNFGVDSGSYPLGSCTMKYNPKVNDLVASLPGFGSAHPLSRDEDVQGTLGMLYELQRALGNITGLPAVSLAPAAGAHGELAGMLIIKRAIEARGELETRRRVLVPDSAHGTNPATAAMVGFEVTEIPSGPDGNMDTEAFERELDETVAALMITLPSTLGIWEHGIEDDVRKVHEAGAYVYGDGANLNAILGRVRFGDLGFDVCHLNLHKTFSTPHGGGGPGAGPVCTRQELADYLPAPVVAKEDDGEAATFALTRPGHSIGRMQQFHGNVGVLIRAYTYIRALGLDGLRETSGTAVLNANYLRSLLEGHYALPYKGRVMHEVVFSGSRQKKENDIRTYDIAKRIIDMGFHPPTVYFPLIVPEALMMEPTETESREGIEAFAEALITIAAEARDHPDRLHAAPVTAPIGRLDEATAARRPVLRWQPPGDENEAEQKRPTAAAAGAHA